MLIGRFGPFPARHELPLTGSPDVGIEPPESCRWWMAGYAAKRVADLDRCSSDLVSTITFNMISLDMVLA